MSTPKKPKIYLVVILPLLLAGVFPVEGLVMLYANIAGIPRAAIPQLNGMLIGLPMFFLWIPLSLLLANCVLHVVRPLRKVAEAYVTEARRPGLLESQRVLGKAALVMAAICIPLIILGFVV